MKGGYGILGNNNTNILNDVISNNNIDTNNVNPNNIDDNTNNNINNPTQKQNKNKQKLVFVLSKEGEPLMPTENNAKVRILLKTKKAKIVKRTPFTI
jgi:hypothetical protein